ncbi:unnamed protein product, partial [Brassica oleracea var. botrytis]
NSGVYLLEIEEKFNFVAWRKEKGERRKEQGASWSCPSLLFSGRVGGTVCHANVLSL